MAGTLIGKTIARVEEPDYEPYGESNLIVLWFDDGTAAKLRPTGYEADGVEIELTTTDILEEEFTEAVEDLIDEHWRRHEGVLRKHHECMQMAEVYGGEDTLGYKKWYQNRFGLSGFAKALRDNYTGTMYAFMEQESRQLWRQKEDQ